MYQSQNSHSKNTTGQDKIIVDTRKLIFRQQLFANFQVIQASSAFFPEQISVKLSGLFKNFNCVKILAYKPGMQGKNRIFKALEDLIGDKTERINSKNCERVSLACDGILKIHLQAWSFKNFYVEVGRTVIVPGKKSNALKSVEKIGPDFQISECLALISSELSFLQCSHTLLSKMIKHDLECRLIPYTLKSSKIQYTESRNFHGFLTNIKTSLSLFPSTIKLKLKLLPNSKPFPRIKELQSILDEYSKNPNILQKTGQFKVKKTLKFTISFHFVCLNSPIPLISQYIDHFLTYSKDIQALSLSRNKSLASSPSMSYKNFIKVQQILTIPQYSKEKAIISLLNSVPGVYFPNRFNSTKITELENNTLVYFVNKNSETFESFSKYSPFVSLQAIFSLIEELKKIGLAFNTKFFPLELFRWSEEKPIFSYEKPLCEVFDIFEVNCEETLEKNCRKIKKNVFDEIYKFKFLAFKEHEITYSVDECMKLFKKTKFEEVDLGIAKERIALYEENRIEEARRYFGIGSVKGTNFLIGCKRFQESLNEKLENFDRVSDFFEFFPGFFNELIQIIESLVAKNTIFGWIDPDCIGFTKKNSVIIEIRAKSEIQDNYKAPEVKGGRSHKSSLLYSFGKIVEQCFFYYFCLKNQENWENCEKQETVQKALENFPELKILIKGCTEEKILTRWNIEKVKSGVKALISRLIN